MLGGLAGLAGGTTIGRAVVQIAGDTSQLSAAFAQTKSETEMATAAASAQATMVRKQLTAAWIGLGIAAVAAMVHSIAATQEWAGGVRTLAIQLGISYEEASKLLFISQSYGVELKSLQTGLGIFEKNLSNSSKQIARYGIEMTNADGSQKSFTDILAATAETFQALPPGVEQAAFVMNVFGRSGRALIPILMRSKEEIKALGLEAESMGLVMSEDDVLAAKELTIAQHQLGLATKGLWVSIGTQLIPVMVHFVEVLTLVVAFIARIPGPIKAAALAAIALYAAWKLAYSIFALSMGLYPRIYAAIVGIAAAEGEAAIATVGFGTALQAAIPWMLAAAAAGYVIGKALASTYEEQVRVTDQMTTFGDDLAKALANGTISQKQYNDAQRQGDAISEKYGTGLKTNAVVMEALNKQYQHGTIDADGYTSALTTMGFSSKQAAGFLKQAAAGGVALENATGSAIPSLLDLSHASLELSVDAQKAADAEIALWQATLTVAGGLNSIYGATLQAAQAKKDLAAADREVQKLETQGKTKTQAYRDALVKQAQAAQASTDAQINVAASVDNYVKSLVDSNKTQDEAITAFEHFARQAGLTKGQIREVEAQIRTAMTATDHYNASLDDVPKNVTTHVSATGVETTQHSIQGLVSTLAQFTGVYKSNPSKGQPTSVVITGPVAHSGGRIMGASGADVAITGQEGEFVMSRAAARGIGYPRLHAMNRMHEGGVVGANSTTIHNEVHLHGFTGDAEKAGEVVSRAIVESMRRKGLMNA